MVMWANVALGITTAIGILLLCGGVGLIFIFETVLKSQISKVSTGRLVFQALVSGKIVNMSD